MYIVNDIAYAGEQKTIIKAKSVKANSDFTLTVDFTDGKRKIFDFKPLFDLPCYKPLKDIKCFEGAYIDCGAVCWNDGEIDIAPETLYIEGVDITEDAAS